MIEWSNASKYNSFNSWKGLTYYEHYKAIVGWLDGKNPLPPPIEASLDPINACNHQCYYCLDKNEKVTMADLSHKKISEVVAGDSVLGVNDNGKIIATKVLKVFDNGRKDWLYQITFADGDSIICSKNHQIWKAERSKWTDAKYLRVGNYGNKILKYGDAQLNNLIVGREYKKGYLAGLASGDGCLWQNNNKKGGKSYRFRLAMKDVEPMERFGNYCNEIGIKWHWGNHQYHYAGKHYKDKALWITDDTNARKIKYLMGRATGKTFKIGWLAGMFDAEGSANTGIRISQNVNTECYNRLKSFAFDLGYELAEESKGIRLKMTLYDRTNFIQRHKPALTRKATQLYLGALSKSKVAIVSIKRIRGQRRVFDLETETHNYFVKGVLVHNCNSQRYLRENPMGIKRWGRDFLEDTLIHLATWGVKAFCWGGGGEALLNLRLPGMTKFGTDLGMECSIITNGTCLTNELIDELLLCRWIGISLDSAKPEVYRYVRGTDDCLKVLGNIYRMVAMKAERKAKTDIAIKVLVLPETIDTIVYTCQVAKDLGVQDFHVRPVDLERKDFKTAQRLNLDMAKIQTIFEECHKLETPDFHVYTVTHKYNENFHVKHDFKRCLASPLVYQLCTDQRIYTCVDHRLEPRFEIKEWGSEEHRQLLLGIDPSRECARCTWGAYNEQISEVVIEDKMCRNFP